jgi:hypothetical protein
MRKKAYQAPRSHTYCIQASELVLASTESLRFSPTEDTDEAL